MLLLDHGLTISNENFSIVLSHQKPSRVIIAVPHDGLIANDFTGAFRTRTSGIMGRDAHVWPIANDMVWVAARRGASVDAVRFLLPRAYADANRALRGEPNTDPDTRGQIALEDNRLITLYRHYRAQLCRLVERSIETFGREQVLFIDLHGFGRQPLKAPPGGYDLILGTAYRTTIPYGDVDLVLGTFAEERGYTVFIPNSSPSFLGGDPYSAGHTTRWFAQRYKINAIQVEIAHKFRLKENTELGKKLALDIAEFFSRQYQ